MRCSILDGRKMKEKQKEMGVVPIADLPDGPVFRIMRGQGVDDDTDAVDYPYDPYSMSAPLTSNEVDAVAIPTTLDGSSRNAITPKEGMRVNVKFEMGESYGGTIQDVDITYTVDTRKRKHRHIEITIKYDDGAVETAFFPDPDISLQMPGK